MELIPNFDPAGYDECPGAKLFAVNLSQTHRLQPCAYGGLDPTASPFRMPTSLLTEALSRVRQCARGAGDYVNPWTRVAFPGWRPFTVTDNEHVLPTQDGQHYTSYLAMKEVFRSAAVARNVDGAAVVVDQVGIQPCIADFNFILPSP